MEEVPTKPEDELLACLRMAIRYYEYGAWDISYDELRSEAYRLINKYDPDYLKRLYEAEERLK